MSYIWSSPNGLNSYAKPIENLMFLNGRSKKISVFQLKFHHFVFVKHEVEIWQQYMYNNMFPPQCWTIYFALNWTNKKLVLSDVNWPGAHTLYLSFCHVTLIISISCTFSFWQLLFCICRQSITKTISHILNKSLLFHKVLFCLYFFFT